MKQNKTLIWFALIPLVFFIPACRRDSGCPDQEPSRHTEYKLSAEDISKIPYTGTDTLVFVSDGGDTATLYGQGKKQYMFETATNRSTDPGCAFFDYEYYEVVSINFISSNTDFFNMNYSVEISQLSLPPFSVMYARFNDYEYVTRNGYAYVNNSNNYKNSVSVGNTTYQGVLIDSVMIYNRKNGVLEVLLKEKTWTLSN